MLAKATKIISALQSAEKLGDKSNLNSTAAGRADDTRLHLTLSNWLIKYGTTLTDKSHSALIQAFRQNELPFADVHERATPLG